MNLVRGEGLSLGYEGEAIIRDFSFSLDEGDYLAVVGENGTGKSTFIKTVLGLVSPVVGRINYAKGFTRRDIGYLPQQSEHLRDFPTSLREVVMSGALGKRERLLWYTREEKKRADEVLLKLRIKGLSNKSFEELSGGERQRALLARALMATDRMLLLDEPVTSLDMKSSSELYETLRELNQGGAAIILVTHDIHPVLSDSTKVLHFSKEGYFFGPRAEYFEGEEGRRFLKESGHSHD